MAKGYEVPADVQIAALKNKPQNIALDLMRPGTGTPWEDRGALGLVKAFLQTCIKSITQPGLLLDHIRRPDTTNEARQFAFGCAALWGISAFIHALLWHLKNPPTWDTSVSSYETNIYIWMVVIGVATGAGVFLLLVVFANRMYFTMVNTEMKNSAPPVLLYNMFCYCLGPSILVLIPIAGAPIAIILIFVAWCVGGAKRLFISWKGSIIASVLTMLIALVIAGAGWFVLSFFLTNALDLAEPPPEPDSSGVYGPAKK